MSVFLLSLAEWGMGTLNDCFLEKTEEEEKKERKQTYRQTEGNSPFTLTLYLQSKHHPEGALTHTGK
jgi:hypothetical protein